MNTFKQYYKTFIWIGVMFYLLFTPSSNLPKTGLISIPHIDKIVHFGMFGVFAFAYLFDSENARLTKRYAIFWLILLSVIFGISSEYIQYTLIPGREGSVYDFIADFIGMLSGIIFYYVVGRRILSKFMSKEPA